jgi:hypothetical protein
MPQLPMHRAAASRAIAPVQSPPLRHRAASAAGRLESRRSQWAGTMPALLPSATLVLRGLQQVDEGRLAGAGQQIAQVVEVAADVMVGVAGGPRRPSSLARK